MPRPLRARGELRFHTVLTPCASWCFAPFPAEPSQSLYIYRFGSFSSLEPWSVERSQVRNEVQVGALESSMSERSRVASGCCSFWFGNILLMSALWVSDSTGRNGVLLQMNDSLRLLFLVVCVMFPR